MIFFLVAVGLMICFMALLKFSKRDYGRNTMFFDFDELYWCRCPGCKARCTFELVKLRDGISKDTFANVTWACACGINLFPTLVNHPVIKNILAEAKLAAFKDPIARESVRIAQEKN